MNKKGYEIGGRNDDPSENSLLAGRPAEGIDDGYSGQNPRPIMFEAIRQANLWPA